MITSGAETIGEFENSAVQGFVAGVDGVICPGLVGDIQLRIVRVHRDSYKLGEMRSRYGAQADSSTSNEGNCILRGHGFSGLFDDECFHDCGSFSVLLRQAVDVPRSLSENPVKFGV